MDTSLYIYYLAGITVVLITASAAFISAARSAPEGKPLLKTLGRIQVILFIASGYMFIAQYLKYICLKFYVDISHWLQIIHSISSTGKPFCFNHQLLMPGTLNYLSAHFVPLLYVIAIPYMIWPAPQTILLVNFILMASSAIPLYKLALHCMKEKYFALSAAAMLLWYPTFQYITLYEFEMLRFSIPVILWMLYFHEKENTTACFALAILAILVREEVGLTIMMFGLYLLLTAKQSHNKSNRYIGAAMAILGLAGFLLITQFIMPSLRSGQNHSHIAAGFFSSFGNSPSEALAYIIRNPHKFILHILQPAKVANIFMLFLPLLFIPLLRPSILICTLANIGTVLLSSTVTHSSYMLYYISPSVPFIFYGFIKSWPRATYIAGSLPSSRQIVPPLLPAVFACLLCTNVFFGPSPISIQFWSRNLRPAPFRTQNFHYSTYIPNHHTRLAQKFVELVPDTAVVSAEHFFHPRLISKRGAFVFPQLQNQDGTIKTDYVLIDRKNPLKTGIGFVPGSWDGMRDNPQEYYDLVEKTPDLWELVLSEDGYCLYKRKTLSYHTSQKDINPLSE